MTERIARSALRRLAASAYWSRPQRLTRFSGRVLILMYHRVIPSADIAASFVQPGMYVTPATFERHLRFLAANFQLLSFDELLGRWRHDAWDDTARYCVVTFDDGWRDNYVHAFPLLRAYGVPATIFLPTALVGTDEWMWPDRLGFLLQRHRARGGASLRTVLAPLARDPELTAAVSRGTPQADDRFIELVKTMPDDRRAELLRALEAVSTPQEPQGRCLLDWDEARQMSRSGVSFGSHSCTHANLPRLGPAERRRELEASLAALRREQVNAVPVLAYPNGDHSDAVVAEARAAGYEAAVTTRAGLETRRPENLFRLRRIGVHEDVSRSVPLLAFHLARQDRAVASCA